MIIQCEIDVIIEKSFTTIIPIEIKSGMTMSQDFFKGLADWQTIFQQDMLTPYVVYGGEQAYQTKHGHVISWHAIAAMLEDIYQR